MSIWRAALRVSHAALGGTGSNTFHLRHDGLSIDAPDDMTEAMGWLEQFYLDLGTVIATGTVVSWDGILQGVGADEGETLETTPWTVNGSASANVLPPANAIVVSWGGAAGDRSKRGRTFIGPNTHSNCDVDGTLTTGALTAVRAAAAVLLESSDSFDNGAVGVWSRQESVIRDFVSATVHDKFAVLRSRRD